MHVARGFIGAQVFNLRVGKIDPINAIHEN
jgi:hypothetical protein